MSAARLHLGAVSYHEHMALGPHHVAPPQEHPQLDSPVGPDRKGNPAASERGWLDQKASCCPSPDDTMGSSWPARQPPHMQHQLSSVLGPPASCSYIIQATVARPGNPSRGGENRVSVPASARRLREGLRAACVHRNRPSLCGGSQLGGEQSSSVYYRTYIYFMCIHR